MILFKFTRLKKTKIRTKGLLIKINIQTRSSCDCAPAGWPAMILRGQRRDPSRSPKSPLPDNHHHYHHHHFCHHIVIIEDKDGILLNHQKLLRLLHIHDRSLEDGSGHQVWSLKSQLVDNSDGIDHLFNDNGILWRVPVLFTAVVVHLNMLISLWSSS